MMALIKDCIIIGTNLVVHTSIGSKLHPYMLLIISPPLLKFYLPGLLMNLSIYYNEESSSNSCYIPLYSFNSKS